MISSKVSNNRQGSWLQKPIGMSVSVAGNIAEGIIQGRRQAWEMLAVRNNKPISKTSRT